MTPEQLKASILQYAIQGKLVEQRAEEGTAQELYQKIQAEKQKLIKEGKIKKEKPLAEITEDEMPFDIPESWKWVRVGNVGSWASGATPSRTNTQFYGGNIPWLKTGDLNDGYIYTVPEYITELALEKNSVRLNPVGSVLMAMYGATIGKLGILKNAMTTNQACCACITFSGVYNHYLFYFLMSQRKSYIGMAEGGAQPNISKEKIVTSVMSLPPLEEQHRIVAKIEELLPLIDRYAESYEKLEKFNAKFPEDMKKSILQYAIQGKLVEQREEEGTAEELYQQIQAEKQKLIKEGKIKKEKPLVEITEDEIPFDIPESWKWSKLGNIVALLSGSDFPPTKYNSNGGGTPYMTGASNIENGKLIINRWTQTPNNISHLNDLLLVCKGSGYGKTVKNTIGDIHIARQFMAFQYGLSIDYDYLNYFLQSQLVHIKKNGQGVIPGIDREFVLNILFPLPPLEEQHRIVAKIEELLPYCDRLIK